MDTPSSDTGLCMLAWKKKTGLGSSIISKQKWEQRWIVVTEGKLQYYRVGDEMESTPRGMINLVENEARIYVPGKNSPDAPTPHELEIAATHPNGNSNLCWKFCFESQQDQLCMLQSVHNILNEGGFYEEKSVDRFEHDFQTGDHVYRWEMIIMPPIIYPIQIHGIVLEAGRNAVILADFGLTGYGKQQGSDFNHAEDHSKSVLAAFKKLRPNQDQRLNICTLTDPYEIRKWHKANYDKNFSNEDKNTNKSHAFAASIGGRMSTLFRRSAESRSMETDSAVAVASDGTVEGNEEKQSVLDATARHGPDTVNTTNGTIERVADQGQRSAPAPTGEHEQIDSRKGSKDTNQDFNSALRNMQPSAISAPPGGLREGRPAWLDDSNDSAVASRPVEQNEEQSAVETVDKDYAAPEIAPLAVAVSDEMDAAVAVESSPMSSPKESHAKQVPQELPRSDPKKIVLARTHFLLEFGEEILPPYHVFFSNSECIAVWCKTGRWSTLQTAVFLSTQTVAGAKYSTVTTLSVAAAHALFAPVVAVGGLIWVSAPMVILQQSRKKWEEATVKLTDLFWDWAPPEVFVEAIEHWSGIHL